MFRFDQAALPQLTIRKALIIVDFQNDFIGAESGALVVTEPRGFVDRTLRLAASFRAQGDVVWVRSRFEKIRPVDHDHIIVSDDDPVPALSTPSQIGSKGAAESDLELLFCPPDLEAFLSHEEPKCVFSSASGFEMPLTVKEAVRKGDLMLTKSHYSAFRDSQLLRILRGKMIMELFICGSLMNVGVHATALDAAGHGMTITIVEDCCGYCHESRQSNAIKKLVELTGCEIASSDELLDTLDPSHSQPSISTESGLQTLLSSPPPCPASKDSKGTPPGASMMPDIVKSMIDLSLASAPPSPAMIQARVDLSTGISGQESQSVMLSATEKELDPPALLDALRFEDTRTGSQHVPLTRQRQLQSAPTDRLTSSRPVFPEDPASEQQETVQNSPTSQHDDETLLHNDLCEGDTDLIQDALPTSIADGAFHELQGEVQWQRMSHQGGEVPRLVAVQGEVGPDGSMPVYRHPADESPALLPFSPTILAIKSETEKHLGHPLNHVLIQFYRDGNDYISEHSDKTLDIIAGSFIANVSLGAERTMVLRTKRPDKDPSRTESLPLDLKRKIQRAKLSHNSLCRMGLQTNMKWTHAIRQDKRDDRDKSPAELAYSGRRISLTFRYIGTFLNSDQTLIWGQGATGKNRDAAHPVINGQNPEAVLMLQAFGAENHSSNFDWTARYGKGFDVLHISNAPRFFASGDGIINMRISLQLADYGISYAKGSMVTNIRPGHNAFDTKLPADEIPVKYVDNDALKSVVYGDVAIMLYLDSSYGHRRRSKEHHLIPDQAELSRDFTRFQKGVNLLKVWHKVRKYKTENEEEFTKVLKKELAIWDIYATETNDRPDQTFMVSKVLCLADFAIWPVLHAIWEDVGPSAFDGLENLQEYYQRVAALESVKSLFSKKGGAST